VTSLKTVDLIVVNSVGMPVAAAAEVAPVQLPQGVPGAPVQAHATVQAHAPVHNHVPIATTYDYTAAAICFALANLSPGATAVIALSLSSLTAPSTVALIHLFAMSFESANIIHTSTEDRTFLCGAGLKWSPGAKQIAQFASAVRDRVSIFTSEYMAGEEFSGTVEKILAMLRTVSEWRTTQYKKLFDTYTEVTRSASAIMIRGHADKIIQSRYQ
jgi:hypothetical protein